MWFLFGVFLVLTVAAATYRKNTPLVTKTTTVKPGLIALLGVLTAFSLLVALASSGKDSPEPPPPAARKAHQEKSKGEDAPFKPLQELLREHGEDN